MSKFLCLRIKDIAYICKTFKTNDETSMLKSLLPKGMINSEQHVTVNNNKD